MDIRRTITTREQVHETGGRTLDAPRTVALAAVVIRNPWHGEGFVEDLQPIAGEIAPQLGRLLTEAVVEALGAPVEAYGKGAVVGLDGELEHGSALIHTLAFGNPFRDACSATTLLPAVEKVAEPGATFDIPLKHITDQTTRSHHQTLEARVSGSPARDEIVVALAAADGGRPHSRLPDFSTDPGRR
jgi:hypothetical protein